MFRNDNFVVPAAPGPLRKAHSRIPGRTNFRRLQELDPSFSPRPRAGDQAAGSASADEAILTIIDRTASVSPLIARPRIRATAASNRLVDQAAGGDGGGGGLPGGGRGGVYRPHINMPETGTPILKSEAITTPAADGSSNTVNSYRVPRGQTLVIKAIWNLYTGPGFVQGATPGMLFRILRDGQPFKGFEGFRFLYGSGTSFFDLAGELLVNQEQTVEMVVVHETGSILPVPSTDVIMAFDGWEYPA
jgi:hypothetical protein